jgi:hypothetical protein
MKTQTPPRAKAGGGVGGILETRKGEEEGIGRNEKGLELRRVPVGGCILNAHRVDFRTGWYYPKKFPPPSSTAGAFLFGFQAVRSPRFSLPTAG